MRRFAKLKFANIFLAAVLMFNQAAFLSVAVAQTTSTPYTAPYTSNYTIPYTPPATYIAPKIDNTTYTAPNTSTTYTSPPAGATYTAPNSPTTSTNYTSPNTDSTSDNNNLAPDGSSIIFKDIITNTLENPPLSILTVNFIFPPTKVSGQPHFPVTTSEPAEVVFYIYKDGAEINRFNAIDKGNNTYSFTWDSTSAPNGQYVVKVSAKKSGYIDAAKQINIAVENASSTLENNFDSTKTDSLSYYELTFVEAYRPPLFGEKRITASLNKEVDSVYFSVEGPRNEKYPGLKDNPRQYYIIWNTSKFPDGYYKVTAEGMLAGQVKTSQSFSIQVVNSVVNTVPATANKPLLEIDQPNTEKIATVEILYECKKNNINTQEECQKFMSIPPDCRNQKIFSQEECQKFKSVPPDCRNKGLLSMEECKKYMSIPPQCREKGIFNQEECKKYSYRFSMPAECQKAGVTTPEECNNIIFLNSLPPECQKSKVTNRGECEKILKAQTSSTPECQKANITDSAACDKYMAGKFMAPECQKANITTQEECNYFLRKQVNNLSAITKAEYKPSEEFKYFEEKYNLPEECKAAGAKTPEECGKIMFLKQAPKECRDANISTPEECKKLMQLASAPEECRAAGVSDPNECQKIMFKKNAPKDCLDAGIDTADKCEKFLFEKSAPTDCKEAGISTMEACKKFMFEKYGGAEKVPADKLPIECQKAQVTTPEECDKVMRTAYMPKECQNQGITDEGKCNLYMQQKNMPKECQEAGVKTSGDCNKVMFKKFGPKECLTAGIEENQECENFMFNKYSQQVTCQGIDGWQCQNSIKERHLGNIVATQTKFQELKDKVSYMAGESITGEKLSESLETAKDIIPITGTSADFKVIKTGEKMVLDDNDNLTQTSPMALMIDSDQDGLPDDMEKMLGTNPNNPDTDGDGYTDGVELKNNYNPAGAGGPGEKLSPVGQAIIENKELEQPKTEGDISEDLAVETISNVRSKEGENKGYVFAGKAEADSVVTLYFYSDLPLIATVKTDEYGNWQYEFTQSLIDGEHEVYVAVNDNTGKITSKSNPLNFFIKEAKATSLTDIISPAPSTTAPTATESLAKYYMIVATLIVIVGILLFVSFIIQKKKQA